MKSQEKPPLFRFIFQFIAETLLSEEVGEWLTVNQMVQIVLDNDPDIKECTIRWAIGRAFQQALFGRKRPESHLKGKPFYYSLTTKGVNYYDWILGQYSKGSQVRKEEGSLEKEFRNMEYRYLVYSIDKHQADPEFRNDIPESIKQNCLNGDDIVVDLKTKKRYWLGHWQDVDCYPY